VAAAILVTIKTLKGEWMMTPVKIIVTASALLFAVNTPAEAGPGAQGHSHAAFSAGQPGNSKKPSRVVEITMSEGNGKMLFSPSRIEVKRGEQVRFVLVNAGELDHEFVLATPEENLQHAEAMKKNPDMEHDDPNAKKLEPRKSGEILWRFTKRGEFQFACLIPGHLDAGMHGKIIVK
jgi:uncharacterized cupredoxin-like copper-binding protein